MNDVHHLHEFTFKHAKTLKIDLETISTFKPFDKILVKIDHQQVLGNINTVVFAKYHEHFIDFELKHQNDDININYIGLLKLKTSSESLRKITNSYIISVDEFKKLDLSLKFNYDDSKFINVLADGYASKTKVDSKFELDQNFLNYSTLSGQLKYSHTMDSTQVDLSITSDNSTLNTSFLIEHLDKYKIVGKLEVQGAKPAVAWFKYSSNFEEKTFQSEINAENVQLFATNFKMMYRNYESISIITDMKVLLRKVSFQVKSENKEKSVYFDTAYGSEITSKIYLLQKNVSKINTGSFLHVFEMDSPNDIFNAIKLTMKTKEKYKKYAARIEINYKELYWVNELKTDDKENSKMFASLQTNIVKELLEIKIEKLFTQNSKEVWFKSLHNEKNFDVDIKFLKVTDTKFSLRSNLNGPSGNTLINGYIDFQQDVQELSLNTIDRYGQEFRMNYMLKNRLNEYLLEIRITTPFTDVLEILGKVELNNMQLNFEVSQPNYTYATISAKTNIENPLVHLVASINLVKLVNLPKLDLDCTLSVNDDIYKVFKDKTASNFNLVLDLQLDENNVISLKTNGMKTDYGITGNINIGTPLESFKQVKAILDLDVVGSEKYAKITLGRNDEEIRSFFKFSQAISKTIAIAKIVSPISGYKILDIDASYDLQNNILHIKAQREDLKFDIVANTTVTSNNFLATAKLTSPSYTWNEIDMNMKLETGNGINALSISGGTEDGSHNLNINSKLYTSSGEAEIKIEMPFLGISNKHFLGSVTTTEDSAEAKGYFNSEKISLNYKKVADTHYLKAVTPFLGFTDMGINVKDSKTLDMFDYSIELNIESKSSYFELKGNNDYSSMDFSLATQLEYLKEVRVNYLYLNNEVNLSLKYKEMSFQGKLKMKESLNDVAGLFVCEIFSEIYRINFEFLRNTKFDTSLKIDLDLNMISLYGDIRIHPSSIEIHTKLPYIGETFADVSWIFGHYHLKIINNSRVILDVAADRENTNFWTGVSKLEIITASEYLRQLTIRLEYDLEKVPDKAMKVHFIYNSLMLDSDFVFKATHDQFDGKMKFTSNIPEWENAVFKAFYNIDRTPEARISILRNGKLEEISIKVRIKGYIPMIDIKTSFIGYENIKLSGKYSNNKGVFMKIEINSVMLLRFNLNFVRAREFQNFDIKSGVPNKVKSRISRHNALYAVDAYISTIDKAYFIEIISPIEDIKLQGQFGTTELKSVFSIGKGRNKREVTVDYKTEQDQITALFSSQTDSWKGVKIGAGYQADAKAGNFNFESYGEYNDFAFGFQYDLTELPQSGFFSGKIVCPSVEVNYSGQSNFSFSDSSYTEGFHAIIKLTKDEKQFISGEINRSPGTTDIKLTTPIQGWKVVRFNLQSDWKSEVAFQLERDADISKLHLVLTEQLGMTVEILTPYSGYENIKAEITFPDNDVSTVRIESNGIEITFITVDVQYDPKTNIGHLETKWNNQNNVSITGKFYYDDKNSAGVILQSSFAKLKFMKIEIEHLVDGDNEYYNFYFKFNEYFVSYKSNQIWTPKSITSTSVTETNLWFLPFKRSESDVHITYSIALDSPFTLKFKSIDDGVITFDVFSSVTVNLKGGELELIYRGDFPLHNGKVDAKLNISSDFDTKIQIIGNLNTHNFNFKLIQVDGKAGVQLKSNIPNFENLKGSATWKVANGPSRIYGLEANLDYHNEKYLGLHVEFDTNPFAKLEAGLNIPGYLDERVSLNLSKNVNKNYQISLSYMGFNNIDLGAKLDLVNLVIEAFIDNKTESRKWNLKIQGDMRSHSPINISFELQLETPFTSKFNSKVGLNLTDPQKKSFETTFTYGDIHASIETFVLLSEKHFLVDLRASCPSLGLDGFGFNIDRNIIGVHYETIKCSIIQNGVEVEGLLLSNFQPEFYDVALEISLPITNYEKLKFFGNGKNAEIRTGTFGVSLHDNDISLKYIWNNQYNIDVILTTPLEIGKKILLKTNIMHNEYYNLETSWDSLELKFLNKVSSNGAKVDYSSTITGMKKIQAEMYVEHNIAKISGVITGFGEDVQIKAEFRHSETETNIDILIDDLSFVFSKNEKNHLPTLEKSISIEVKSDNVTKSRFDYKIIMKEDENEFGLTFSCPLLGLQFQEIKLNVKTKYTNAEQIGDLLLSYNGNAFSLNIGHTYTDNLTEKTFFNLKLPISLGKVRLDFERKNGDSKLILEVLQLSLDSEFKKSNQNMQYVLNTKFTKWVLSIDLNLELLNNHMRNVVILNNKTISLDVKFDENFQDAEILFKSPFKDLESIKAMIKIKTMLRKKEATLEFLAPNIKVIMKINIIEDVFYIIDIFVNIKSSIGKYTIPVDNTIKMNISMKDDQAEKKGSLKLKYSNSEISISIGSNVGHIYMEVVMPFTDFKSLKVDINHNNGDLRVLVVSSILNLETKFIKKNTIYNFDIQANIPDKVFAFTGKIDISGKGLFTMLQWNSNKLSMKANYSGQKVSISLKSPFTNFRNIILKGSWKNIDNGFNVIASGELNLMQYEFEAQFTRKVDQTIGFWRATNLSNNEKVRFDIDVTKKPNTAMHVTVKIAIPGQRMIKTLAGFSLDEKGFEGEFEVTTPFKDIVPNTKILFKAEKENSQQMSFGTSIIVEEKEIEIQTIYSFENSKDIHIKAFLNIPALLSNKIIDFEIIHELNPKKACYSFTLETPVSEKIKASCNSTYPADKQLLDISLTFPLLRIEELRLTSEIWNETSPETIVDLRIKLPGQINPVSAKFVLSKSSSNVYSEKQSNFMLNCNFSLTSPYSRIVPDTTIALQFAFDNVGSVRFEADILAPDRILLIATSLNFSQTTSLTMTSTMEVPRISTKVAIDFASKAVSRDDLEFFVTFSLNNIPYGLGVTYKRTGQKLDAVIVVKNAKEQRKVKFGGEHNVISPTTNKVKIYINDAVFICRCDTNDGNFSLNASFHNEHIDAGPLYLNFSKNIEIDIEYSSMRSTLFRVSAEAFGNAEFKFLTNNDEVTGIFFIDLPDLGIKKSVKLILKLGMSGSFEVSIFDGENTLDLQIPIGNSHQIRSRRSTGKQSLGPIQFNEASKFSKGVLVISTASGLHKLSYDLDKKDVIIHIESPYLENGYATLKLKLDGSNGLYRGSLAMNESNLLSGYLTLSNTVLELNINFESSYIQDKLSLHLIYNNIKEGLYMGSIDVLFKTRHYISYNIGLQEKKMLSIIMNSLFIPFEQISLETEFKKKNTGYEGIFGIAFGEELIRLSFDTKIKSFRDFELKSIMTVTQLAVEDGQISVKFDFDENKELRMTYTMGTSKYEWISILENIKEEWIGKISITSPVQNYNNFECEINTVNAVNPKNMKIKMNLFMPIGESIGVLSWNVENNEEFTLFAKLDVPEGYTFFVSTNIIYHNKSLNFKSFLPYFGSFSTSLNTLSSTTSSDLLDERISFRIDIFYLVYKGDIDIGYSKSGSLEINGKLETPHSGFHKQTISLGFANTVTRQMVKAYVDCSYGSSGISFDYSFLSIQDFVFQGMVNFPHPDWSDFSIDIGNQLVDDLINIRIGGSYEERSIKLNFMNTNGKTMVEMKLNENILIANHLIVDSKKLIQSRFIDFDINTFSFNSKSNVLIESSNQGMNFYISSKLNDDEILNISKNSDIKKFHIVINNLYTLKTISTSLNYDFDNTKTGTIGAKTVIITNKEFVFITEAFARKTTSGGNLKVKYKNFESESIEVKVLVQDSSNEVAYALQILQGKSQSSVLELIAIQHIGLINKDNSNTHMILKSPFYCFDFEDKCTIQGNSKITEKIMKYGVPGDRMQGLGFQKSLTEDIDGKTNRKYSIRRPKGVLHEKESLAVILSSEANNHGLIIKLNPDIADSRFLMKVI